MRRLHINEVVCIMGAYPCVIRGNLALLYKSHVCYAWCLVDGSLSHLVVYIVQLLRWVSSYDVTLSPLSLHFLASFRFLYLVSQRESLYLICWYIWCLIIVSQSLLLLYLLYLVIALLYWLFFISSLVIVLDTQLWLHFVSFLNVLLSLLSFCISGISMGFTLYPLLVSMVSRYYVTASPLVVSIESRDCIALSALLYLQSSHRV